VASRTPAFLRRRRVVVGLQLALVAVILAFLGYAVRDVGADAVPRLADADPVYVAAALGVLGAYYLLFAVGWWWLLAAFGIRVSYGIALQAEMASMLAKYVPGGIWTPLARIVWLRRAGGVSDTSFVVSSILLEAGLSAVAGILVFTAGLAAVDAVEAPLVPLLAFGVTVVILLHPRVFTAIARVVFRRFGAPEPPRLSYRILLGLLGYYVLTWLVGGTALYLLLRSLDADPGVDTIPYLGGAAAVGAIVAVLAVFAPSGLGVREASMYGLLVVVVPASAALGATVLNRLAITLVEAALLGGGVLVSRLRRDGARSPVAADREVDERPEEREEDRHHDPDGLLTAGDARVPEDAHERDDDQDERHHSEDRVEPVDHA
jgi:glycosyltransferase 2 family protein